MTYAVILKFAAHHQFFLNYPKLRGGLFILLKECFNGNQKGEPHYVSGLLLGQIPSRKNFTPGESEKSEILLRVPIPIQYT
jgi:hypothetical protein